VEARNALAVQSAAVPLAFAFAPPIDVNDFDFLFPSLQTPNNLLPETSQIPERLKIVGRSMQDANILGGANDSTIPAAYTYFGQFVDHDITLEVQDSPASASGTVENLLDPKMTPLPWPRSGTRCATSGPRPSTWTACTLFPRSQTRTTAPR
jgi:hypothetical protein